jgi:hypothetical protein
VLLDKHVEDREIVRPVDASPHQDGVDEDEAFHEIRPLARDQQGDRPAHGVAAEHCPIRRGLLQHLDDVVAKLRPGLHPPRIGRQA